MKVYIVEWFSLEPYESISGVHKVFSSRDAAQEYVDAHKDAAFDGEIDEDDWYGVSTNIEEYTVE